MRNTIDNLLQEVETEFLERLKEYGEDPQDIIHEVADSSIPVYTRDILELCLSDMSLFTDQPELGPAYDGTPTPHNVVVDNIYERLSTHLSEVAYEYEKNKEEINETT